MEERIDYWSYPEGYEAVKALIDFLPEEEKDMYLQMLVSTFLQA